MSNGSYSFIYNVSGNQAADPRNNKTLYYSPSERVSRINYNVGSVLYFYNALGQRHNEVVSGLLFGIETGRDYHIYHYGLDGHLLYESRSGSSPSRRREYIYING